VKVCLTRNAMWYPTLGVFEPNHIDLAGEQHRLLPPDTITRQTPYGELYRLAPPVQFSETPAAWDDPILTVRGSCKPEWLSKPNVRKHPVSPSKSTMPSPSRPTSVSAS
jgi:hypothetical protein